MNKKDILNDKETIKYIRGIVLRIVDTSKVEWEEVHGYCLVNWVKRKNKIIEASNNLEHFKNLLAKMVKYAFIDYLREFGPVTRQGRYRPFENAVSLDTPLTHKEVEIETLMDTIEDEKSLEFKNKIEVHKAIKKMDKKLANILSYYYLDSYNLAEIGKMYGVGEARMSYLLAKAKENFKEVYVTY